MGALFRSRRRVEPSTRTVRPPTTRQLAPTESTFARSSTSLPSSIFEAEEPETRTVTASVWPACTPSSASRASIPGPSKRSSTRPARTPLRVNRPDPSVVVSRAVPGTLTRRPETEDAPTPPDAEPPVWTVPAIVAPAAGGTAAAGASGPVTGEEPPPQATVAAVRPAARRSRNGRDRFVMVLPPGSTTPGGSADPRPLRGGPAALRPRVAPGLLFAGAGTRPCSLPKVREEALRVRDVDHDA